MKSFTLLLLCALAGLAAAMDHEVIYKGMVMQFRQRDMTVRDPPPRMNNGRNMPHWTLPLDVHDCKKPAEAFAKTADAFIDLPTFPSPINGYVFCVAVESRVTAEDPTGVAVTLMLC